MTWTWWAVLPLVSSVATMGSGVVLGRHTIRSGSPRDYAIYQVLFILGIGGAVAAGVQMVAP